MCACARPDLGVVRLRGDGLALADDEQLVRKVGVRVRDAHNGDELADHQRQVQPPQPRRLVAQVARKHGQPQQHLGHDDQQLELAGVEAQLDVGGVLQHQRRQHRQRHHQQDELQKQRHPRVGVQVQADDEQGAQAQLQQQVDGQEQADLLAPVVQMRQRVRAFAGDVVNLDADELVP